MLRHNGRLWPQKETAQESALSHRFSQSLKAQNQTAWDACTKHRFIAEMMDGTLDDAVLRRYLVQDYQFINQFVALLGAAIASADVFAPRVTLSQFAAMITSDENTYFIRSFDALGVPEQDRVLPQLTLPTVGFQALMAEAARSQKYANCLAVLCVAEGLYLDGFDKPLAAMPPRFEHAEWIHLHANDFFRGFVAWLRAELDRIGEQIDPPAREEAADFFYRAVELERQFFDHVYQA